jgi:SsrA-binding protein
VSLIFNKKARFDYELGDKFEAGLELIGIEVKSIRQKHGELSGAHITVRNGEAFIVNFEIPPYQATNTPNNYEPTRTRKLLLTKKEIRELVQKTEHQHLTIIPVSIFEKNHKLKLEIAIAKSKKKFDKRETIKKRDVEKEIGRSLKN